MADEQEKRVGEGQGVSVLCDINLACNRISSALCGMMMMCVCKAGTGHAGPAWHRMAPPGPTGMTVAHHFHTSTGKEWPDHVCHAKIPGCLCGDSSKRPDEGRS